MAKNLGLKFKFVLRLELGFPTSAIERQQGKTVTKTANPGPPQLLSHKPIDAGRLL